MEVQPPNQFTILAICSSLNVSILTIIQLYIDFSEGLEFGDSFIADIVINLILLTNIFIAYFFGKHFSFAIRIIISVIFCFLYISYLISGVICRSPLSNSSLIGVYNFTIFMRLPLLIVYLFNIIIYMFESD